MRFLKFILLPALVIAASCQKPAQAGGNGNDTVLEWPDYIWFGADVSTKTPIIETMRGRSFDVVAFKYSKDTDWTTFKATGTPASSATSGSGADLVKGFAFPTHVNCASNGVCSYDYNNTASAGPSVWQGGKKYSFFAFYPQAGSSVSGEGGVSLSSTASTASAPVISYSVPSWTNPDLLPDVMTSAATDLENKGDGTVAFMFKHKLCMLCVEARNLDETPIQIRNLTLELTSKVYTSISIPLDGSACTPSGSKTGGIAYVLRSGESDIVTVETFGANDSAENTLISGNKNVMFIPMDPDGPDGNAETSADNMPYLTGNICLQYRENKGGDSWSEWRTITTDDDGGNYLHDGEEFEAARKFEAGKRYSFVVTFANGAITIAVIESGEWTNYDQYIEFE